VQTQFYHSACILAFCRYHADCDTAAGRLTSERCHQVTQSFRDTSMFHLHAHHVSTTSRRGCVTLYIHPK